MAFRKESLTLAAIKWYIELIAAGEKQKIKKGSTYYGERQRNKRKNAKAIKEIDYFTANVKA